MQVINSVSEAPHISHTWRLRLESLVLLILGKWYLWGWCTQRPFWVLVAFHTPIDCVVWECMISIRVISFVSTSKITKELSRLWILHTSVPFISSLSSMPSTSRQPWLMKEYSPGSSFAMSFSGDTGHADMCYNQWFVGNGIGVGWLFLGTIHVLRGNTFMLFSGRDGRSGRSLTLMMLMDDGILFAGVCCLE